MFGKYKEIDYFKRSDIFIVQNSILLMMKPRKLKLTPHIRNSQTEFFPPLNQ